MKDAPNYPIGHSINLGAQVVVLALALFGIGYCKWENRVRPRGGRDYCIQGLTEQENLDLGHHHHHPEFKYIARTRREFVSLVYSSRVLFGFLYHLGKASTSAANATCEVKMMKRCGIVVYDHNRNCYWPCKAIRKGMVTGRDS